MDYDEYMKRYEGFKKCEHCGKYDMPPTRWPGPYSYRLDYSMVCDGIQTMGPDPFGEEIHGDHTEYLMCEGERWDSAQNI